MVSSNLTSPEHFGLDGDFSAEDIQDLLGAMAEEHAHNHDARPVESTTSSASEDGGSAAGEPKGDVPEEAKAQARSERKRSREKQRRSDVNKQFTDLTQILRTIEEEEAEENNGLTTRLAFNPSNRVDLIARTSMHLERLQKANKRQKLEVQSLQQQLDQAKKAGEETAAKLKETMFNQPAQNKHVSPCRQLYCALLCVHVLSFSWNTDLTIMLQFPQVMMMVPMMLQADGPHNFSAAAAMGSACMSGSTMPMMANGMAMNPFMMPQPFMTQPAQMQPPAAAPVAAAPVQPPQQPQQQPQQQPIQPHMLFPNFASVMAAAQRATSMPSQQQLHAPMQHQQPILPQTTLPLMMSQGNSFGMTMPAPTTTYTDTTPAAVAAINNHATVAPPVTTTINSSQTGSVASAGSTSSDPKPPPQQQGNGGSNYAHCA